TVLFRRRNGPDQVETKRTPVGGVHQRELVQVLFGRGDLAFVVGRIVAGQERQVPVPVDLGANVGRTPVGLPAGIVLDPQRSADRHRAVGEPPVDLVLLA